MANGRCRIHGGTTPKGIASPNWKHGRYSSYVPKDWQGTYERMRNDRELLDLSHNVAMLWAMEEGLAKEYDAQEVPDWKEAVKAYRQYVSSNKNTAVNLAQLGKVLEEGANKAMHRGKVRSQLIALGVEKRDMAMAESKRRMELEGMLDIREGLAVVTRVLDSLVEVAKDPSVAREDIPRIAYERMAKMMPKEVVAEVVSA